MTTREKFNFVKFGFIKIYIKSGRKRLNGVKTENERWKKKKCVQNSRLVFFSLFFFLFASKCTFSKLNTVPVKIHFKFINIVPSCYWSKSGVCNDIKAHLIKLSSKNFSVNWKWVPFTSLFLLSILLYA